MVLLYTKGTSGAYLLMCVCAIGLSAMEAHSGSLERSVRAMAILLIMAGDVEQNPGPLPPATASPESRALRHHFASLVTAITDPLMLSLKLFSAGIIEQATKDEARVQTTTTTQKNDILLSAVMNRVNTDPSLFHCFVDLLKNDRDDILKFLGGKLEDTYKFAKGDTEQCTLSPLEKPSHSEMQASEGHPQPSQSHTQPSHTQTQSSQPHSQLASHCYGEKLEPPTEPGVDPSKPLPKANHKESESVTEPPIAKTGLDPSCTALPKTDHKEEESISEPLTIEHGEASLKTKLPETDHKGENISELTTVEPKMEDTETEQLELSGDDGSVVPPTEMALVDNTTSKVSSDLEESCEFVEPALLLLPSECEYFGENLPEHVSLITPKELGRYRTPGTVWLPVEYPHIKQVCWLILTSPSVLKQERFRLPPLVLQQYSSIHAHRLYSRLQYLQHLRGCEVINEKILFACMTRDMNTVASLQQILISVCLTGWLHMLQTLDVRNSTIVQKLFVLLVYCACCSGKEEIVKYLVLKYGDILFAHADEYRHQLNALHVACCRGSLDIVIFLLQGKYYQVDSMDEYNTTPLHYAAFFGHMHIVQYLIAQYKKTIILSAPSDTSKRHRRKKRNGKGKFREELRVLSSKLNNIDDSTGNTPLHLAVHGGHTEIVKFFIAGEYFSADIRNHCGNTPLFVACEKGHSEIVHFLLIESDCDADLANDNGNTPLLASCEKGNTDIVKYLLTGEYCTANFINKLGNTPLLVSCENGHAEIVEFLLTNKYNTADCENRLGNTPLLVSCENGHTEIVKFLITGKHCTANLGNSPLLASCKNGHTEIVKFLLSGKHCTASEDCLCLACSKGHTNIVKFLLTGKYCTVNCADKNGNTPLHLACEGRNLEIVKFLITEQHTLTSCINKMQNTPLHLVCKGSIGTTSVDRPHLLFHYHRSRFHNQQSIDNTVPPCIIYKRSTEDVLNIVKLLANNGLSPTTKGHNGNTAVHYACVQQLPGVTEYLLEQCDFPTYEEWANNNGNTPLHLACRNALSHGEAIDIEVISSLVKSGRIDPLAVNRQGQTAMDIVLTQSSVTKRNEAASILAYYHKNAKIHGSLEPAMKLFVLGNPRIGKTTLVRALCILNSLPAGMEAYVSVLGSEPTAGIDVVGLRDKQFGPVSVHDLAGQKEYYASHDALVQNLITASVAIFVITIKLADSDNIIRESLQYWMSFIDNCCSRVQATGRVIIVGSWADEVPISADEFSCKWTDEIKSTVHVTIVGFIPLDCRQIELDKLNCFRQLVQESCKALQSAERPFSSHECAVYAFILEHLQDKVACTVNDLAECIRQSELNTTLPTKPNVLSHILSGLSDGGQLLYLPNEEDIGAGWVILRKETLLSDINGTIFAPENFKKQFKFDTSTGVVSEAVLSQAFPEIDPHMIVQVMTHFEFCQRIEDPATVSLIFKASGHSNTAHKLLFSECYYFFPALVHADYPEHLLEASTHDEEYQSGWCIECASETQFFSPHFLHVLLLRLAFTFALAPTTVRHEKDSPVMQRKCTVWRNGIQWLNDDGVEALVEVVDQRQCFLLLKGEEMELVKQRSAIIAEILNTKREYCPNICTEESILDLTHSPFNSIAFIAKAIRQKAPDIIQYRVADIANAVSRQKAYVINPHKMKIYKLLYFEPYVGLQQNFLCKLFEEENAHVKVNSDVFPKLAEDFYSMFRESSKICGDIAKMLTSLPSFQSLCQADFAGSSRDNSMDCYLCLFNTWKSYDNKKTFASLRSLLDKYSIFRGRNPLKFTEEQVSAPLKGHESHTCTASIESVQPSPTPNPPSKPSTTYSSAQHSQSTSNSDLAFINETADVSRQMINWSGYSPYGYRPRYGRLPRQGEMVATGINVTWTEMTAIQKLESYGYSAEQAARAYFECCKDVEAAKLWLIENAKCTQDWYTVEPRLTDTPHQRTPTI